MRPKTEMPKSRWINERRSQSSKLLWLRRTCHQRLNVLGEWISRAFAELQNLWKTQENIIMKSSSNRRQLRKMVPRRLCSRKIDREHWPWLYERNDTRVICNIFIL